MIDFRRPFQRWSFILASATPLPVEVCAGRIRAKMTAHTSIWINVRDHMESAQSLQFASFGVVYIKEPSKEAFSPVLCLGFAWVLPGCDPHIQLA
mmetsp:Transcript_46852/g.130476  ORF Transcript_46852/g.130476 Transcript_46852/m.130476 type:complete len:95 (-) Transcript_46852:763-1047(-)